MELKELIQWLRANSSGVYRPAKEAADRLETMERTLRQMAECNDDPKLSDCGAGRGSCRGEGAKADGKEQLP